MHLISKVKFDNYYAASMIERIAFGYFLSSWRKFSPVKEINSKRFFVQQSSCCLLLALPIIRWCLNDASALIWTTWRMSPANSSSRRISRTRSEWKCSMNHKSRRVRTNLKSGACLALLQSMIIQNCEKNPAKWISLKQIQSISEELVGVNVRVFRCSSWSVNKQNKNH